MRILRTILWVICVLILLAIGSVVALYFLVTPQTVQNRLQSSFGEVGLTIRTNELPTVRLLPTISVALPSAQLFDAQNKLIAFYRSAQFTVSPWWLAFGKVHVDDILIDGFSLQETECPTASMWLKNNVTDKTKLFDNVTVGSVEFNNSDLRIRREGYLVNFQNLRATFSAPAPQMHTPVAVAAQVQILPDNLLLDLEAAFSLDLNLASGQMSFENVVLTANGTQQGRSFHVQLNSPLAQITEEKLYAKTADIQLTGDQSLGDVALSAAELQIEELTWQAPDLYLRYTKGSGNQALKLDLRSPVIFDRQKALYLADHIQGTVTLPGQTESIPLSGKLSTDWNNEQIQGEFFARVHGAPMSFLGESAGFDHPSIKGDIVFGRLELRDLSVFNSLQKAQQTLSIETADSEITSPTQAAEAPETADSEAVATKEPEAQPDAQVTDPVSPQENSEGLINANENSPSAPSEVISPETEAQETQAAAALTESPNIEQTPSEPPEAQTQPAQLQESALSEEKDFDFLNHFDFKGTLVVGELVTGPVKLVQLKSDMNVQNGVLRLPKAQALTYDGKTELDAQINSQGLWNVTYKAESVNLSSLFADANGNSKTSGVLSLQANLYGSGFTQETLNGQVGFSAGRSKLFGFHLNDAVKALKAYKEPTQNTNLFTETNLIGGIATIHDAKATIERLTVDFGHTRARGQAEIDLSDGTVSGQLLAQDASGLDLTMSLSGQWQNPVALLDVEKIKKDNNLVQKPKDAPKPSGWDKLKNFFRERF